MWHILLMILQILSIILAVLLGLILLLLICLLFVPFSYRIKGAGGCSEERKEFQLLLSLNWLLLSCKGRICGMPAEMRWVVRFLFFPVYDSGKKSDRKKKEASEEPQWEALELSENTSALGEDEAGTFSQDENVLWEDAAGDFGQNSHQMMEEGAEDRIDIPDMAGSESVNRDFETSSVSDRKEKEVQNMEISDSGGAENTASEQAEEAGKKEGKIKALYHRLISIRENIQYTIQNICDKIKAILNNITYYTDLIRGTEFRQAFRLSRKELFRILRSIRPRKGRLHIEAGLGDPASTGQLVSFYGILYPWIGKYILLQTDFETKRLKAEGFLKGRITIIVILIAGLRLYLNKNLKRVIRMLKKEDIQNG